MNDMISTVHAAEHYKDTFKLTNGGYDSWTYTGRPELVEVNDKGETVEAWHFNYDQIEEKMQPIFVKRAADVLGVSESEATAMLKERGVFARRVDIYLLTEGTKPFWL